MLARKYTKTLLLTGTLMGGYADDPFHLLWRLDPGAMLDDGFRPSESGRMGAASMTFMREHGILKDVYKETASTSHRTAKGRRISHCVSKIPGFGPKGNMRFVLPITAFLKLRNIGQDLLPPYDEAFDAVAMTEAQALVYQRLSAVLVAELRAALRANDTTLLGVVLNVLLAWPDCCFRAETVAQPRTRRTLAFKAPVMAEGDISPKEQALADIRRREKETDRRVQAYTIYTGMRDTSARLKSLLDERGFKAAVLRASVDTARREDWVAEQVDRGVDVVVGNPELVKTGLDLLEFPTIVFMQSDYNVCTAQQASHPSWLIGQRQPVRIHYPDYAGTAQLDCPKLMAKKIAVSQSMSGTMPDSELDGLNDAGDSIEVVPAKRLLA